MNPKLPVYERMRSPIKPPLPRALNRPTIRVVKWRKVADHLTDRLDHHPGYVPQHQVMEGLDVLHYIWDWIRHAEGILNGEVSPDTPFTSTHKLPAAYRRSDRWDPHHVHPTIKPFDSSFCLP